MYKCFLEIALEAELCTEESPELLEAAKELCNENPTTRPTAIMELRQMIYERGLCNPPRTDDAYLLRFLRARNFIVPRAHKLLVRACQFREQYKDIFEGVDLWGLVKIKEAYQGTLYDTPDIGRLSIFRFGTWDPGEFPVEDLVRAGMAMFDIAMRQPKLQVLGGTVIVDLEGITLRHVTTLTPTVAYQIVCLMGLANPGRLRSTHLINYSWILNTFFYLFKRFIPRQAWNSIHFHGNDHKSLQQHIPLECLPPRYGGTCKSNLSYEYWLRGIKKYRDESFDREMKELGYVIKE